MNTLPSVCAVITFKPLRKEYALEFSFTTQFLIFTPTEYSPMPLATTMQVSPDFKYTPVGFS